MGWCFIFVFSFVSLLLLCFFAAFVFFCLDEEGEGEPGGGGVLGVLGVSGNPISDLINRMIEYRRSVVFCSVLRLRCGSNRSRCLIS